MFQYKCEVLKLHFDLGILVSGAISCQSILGVIIHYLVTNWLLQNH